MPVNIALGTAMFDAHAVLFQLFNISDALVAQRIKACGGDKARRHAFLAEIQWLGTIVSGRCCVAFAEIGHCFVG